VEAAAAALGEKEASLQQQQLALDAEAELVETVKEVCKDRYMCIAVCI